jgi:hypothetical protein
VSGGPGLAGLAGRPGAQLLLLAAPAPGTPSAPPHCPAAPPAAASTSQLPAHLPARLPARRRGLRAFGTDFTAIAVLFPGRDRTQLKGKFKAEYRHNRDKIELAMDGGWRVVSMCVYVCGGAAGGAGGAGRARMGLPALRLLCGIGRSCCLALGGHLPHCSRAPLQAAPARQQARLPQWRAGRPALHTPHLGPASPCTPQARAAARRTRLCSTT